MIKQCGVIVALAALLLAMLALAGCPGKQAAGEGNTAQATPPPSAAVSGAQAAQTSVTYDVKGMTCESCVNGITGALSAVPGVKQCKVDLASASATVDYDPLQVTDQMIIDRINGLGYTASLKQGGALAAAGGEAGCACGGSGECSGECGDPAQAGAKAAGGCAGNGACAANGMPADIPEGCVRKSIFVEGVADETAAAKLAQSITALAGVAGAYADFAKSKIVVDYKPEAADPKAFDKAITDAGYKVLDTPPAREGEGKRQKPAQGNQDA